MVAKRIVIVGGGFAGMNLAKSLSNKNGLEVTLVDKNNYHFFPPLLYQVSTAFIESSNISYPFRKMFQNKNNIHFHNGSLEKIDVARNEIETSTGTISYDYLVLAMGTKTNYFGMENILKYALPMKTIDDALNMRNQLLLNLEKATRVNDKIEKQKLTTVVIAGGGPTGVEVAGMIAEMGRHVINNDYPELKGQTGTIYLVDTAKNLLSSMSEKAQKEAKIVLTDLGVQIKLGISVKDFVDGKVILSTCEEIETSILIWASGVVGQDIVGLPEKNFGKGKRLLVDQFNRVEGIENLFAIGDISLMIADAKYPNGHPQLAQVAIQQGNQLAKNFVNILNNKPLQPFRYFNKGSMAIISKYKAVVDLPKGFYKGFFAWLTWLFIHIIPIAGFRNKAKLAYNWFWSFITNDPTLRLIIRPKK